MAQEISLREYSQRIEEYLRNARIDEAIAHASQILSAYPKNANAYRNLGRALMRQQRYEEAGEIFRRLLGAIPDDFSAHYQLSIVYEQGKQADAALFHIERAFDQQPNNKQVNDRLRALYKSLKNVEVEKIQLTAGAVANQYLKAASFEQAIDLLKRTIEKMPDRTDLRLLLARVYWDAGRAVDAAEACLALLKTSPYVLEANRIMTEFWLEQERPSDAQRFLSRVEELDPYLAFEIATGKAVPDNQFMLEELDFAKYAASVTAQHTPDWLENIEAQQEAAPAQEADWLKAVDESAKPPTPAKKKVTDSLEGLLPDDFDFPESAGIDDSVSNDEEDELAALLGGTGLTDLLGTSDDSLVSGQSKRAEERTSTGLTGMLRNLGGDDEEEDDSWLQELSSGRYDTGELGAKKAENIDDLFADMATDVKDTNEFNPAAETAVEEDPLGWLGLDDEEEAASTVEDTGGLSTVPAQAYDPNDPMAWLQGAGIDFDDSVEAAKPNFFEDNEPTALPSKANDPMAWLGGDDERHLDTNEFKQDVETVDEDNPLAWLGEDVLDNERHLDTNELSTSNLASEESDPLAWMSESSEADSPDWQSDDDVLAELLDLASLTDEHEAVPDYPSETEAVMNNQSNWTDNELPDDDEDLGLEWLDDEGQADSTAWMSEEPANAAPETEEDPLAWLTGEAEEDAMAWMSEEPAKASAAPEFEEDPMAWLAGSTESTEPEAVAANTDDLNDLFGEESAEESGFDFFAEEEAAPADDFDFMEEEPAEEAPTTTGMTGMLDRLKAAQGQAQEEPAEWLGTLDTSDAFDDAEDLSWLNTLDGKDSPEATPAETSAVSEFAADFGGFGGESSDEMDWGSSESSESFAWGTSEESEAAAELDWATGGEVTGDDFGDFGDEEAEPAEEMDWMSSLGSETDDFGAEEAEPAMTDDFSFGDEEAEPAEELDWMSSLGSETDDFGAEEAEPAMTDNFGFGEEAEPAEELDWMSSLGSETDDFGAEEAQPAMTSDFGDFGDEEAEPALTSDFGDFGDEEAEPAEELDWMSSLGSETDEFGDEESEAAEELDWAVSSEITGDDFGFGDEEAEPAEEMDWMSSLGSETDELAEEAAVTEEFDNFGEEEAEATGTAWGDIGSTGFTGELQEEAEATPWGDIGSTGFTDELHEEAEPAEELDWLSSVDDDMGDIAEDVEEEEPLPQKSTFGMTGMLNSIRASRGEELEETLGSMEEPDWLDHLDEEEVPVAEAEPEAAETYQPLPPTAIDNIDWGDIVSSQEIEALPFEDTEMVEAAPVEEARPIAEILRQEPEPSFVAETVSSYDDSDENGHNAPDWLNAMVPGLDLDFEAEEDAAIEADYAERERNLRERRLSEEAQTSDFAWLNAIVEEESGMMNAVSAEEDYVAPAPPPLPQRQQYRFSQLPLWLRQSPASAIAMSASEAPDYLSDFEDFDDSGDFDEFDDDFEFEDDDEFNK